MCAQLGFRITDDPEDMALQHVAIELA
jgi:hypothetical protein